MAFGVSVVSAGIACILATSTATTDSVVSIYTSYGLISVVSFAGGSEGHVFKDFCGGRQLVDDMLIEVAVWWLDAS
ncbi:hypothetical protein GN244_ATG17714 [Phytophthora infestans]|uniref:Secreted RxLR effector peptide protein n=1 Tax=Phytophthora infestans TaxID=4787 RepID=A0A833S9V0_PHYIN|nr:hypothetical protein GN244_ATG17714 [Phytophthora infestans]